MHVSITTHSFLFCFTLFILSQYECILQCLPAFSQKVLLSAEKIVQYIEILNTLEFRAEKQSYRR